MQYLLGSNNGLNNDYWVDGVNKQNNTSRMISFLKSMKSYRKFNPDMLPPDISKQDIIYLFKFISPQIVLIHGSSVTNTRYSPDGSGDIDIIVASIKCAFWPLEELYNEIKYRLNQKFRIIIDVCLVTPNGLFAHIKNTTSIGQSLKHGFTILYYK